MAPGRRPKKRGRPFAMTPRFRRSKKVAKKGDGFDGFGKPAPPLCVEGNGGSPPTSGSWSVQIRSKDTGTAAVSVKWGHRRCKCQMFVGERAEIWSQ